MIESRYLSCVYIYHVKITMYFDMKTCIYNIDIARINVNVLGKEYRITYVHCQIILHV